MLRRCGLQLTSKTEVNRPREDRRPTDRGAVDPRALGIAALAVLYALGHCAKQANAQADHATILRAIRLVESGGRDEPPDGDGGLAIGPYQIHRAYWQDAIGVAPGIGGSYDDCRDRAYAERIVEAYMRRWAPDAWAAHDAEVIARIHNGGPRGSTNPATLGYWARVRQELESSSTAR